MRKASSLYRPPSDQPGARCTGGMSSKAGPALQPAALHVAQVTGTRGSMLPGWHAATMPTTTTTTTTAPAPATAPWYQPVADEVQLFEAAWAARLPVLLKGPTGCSKTRFIEHMAARVPSARTGASGVPLITVSCHEDLTANDLVGRHLLQHDQTLWADGPLTRAVRSGAICYLDEIVEARRDTTVVLPIEKTGEQLAADADFLLVVSYNPGYQTLLKDLKPSTRQRFVSLAFDYPAAALEAVIVAHESGIDAGLAERLSAIAQRLRALQAQGLGDGVSTRALIHAALLVTRGIALRRACAVALADALGDDPTLALAAREVIDVLLP